MGVWGPAGGRGTAGEVEREESAPLRRGRIIRGGYLGNRGGFTAERLLGSRLRGGGSRVRVKGLAVPFQSRHMGPDIMHLCPMPGSGKGYDSTPWPLVKFSHSSCLSPDQGPRLLAHLLIMQVVCWVGGGGRGFCESEQSADVCKATAGEPCASRGTPVSLMRLYIL